MRFDELNLPRPILAALQKIGFEELTPIQEATYSLISSGRDLCALAETGSGKTAACVIPLVQTIDTSVNAIQGLVIVPTRELCLQYVDEVNKIASTSGVAACAIYGGARKDLQIAQMKHQAHILVATPGRLIDLVYDRVIDFGEIRCAILDEADELLKEGFIEDISFILSCITHPHQTLLFSATMPDDIKKLAHDYLRDPEHISLIAKRAAPKAIEHWFLYCHPKDKQRELVAYLEKEKATQAIIFCNARHVVDSLFRTLRKDFRDVEYIHAGLSQDKRTSLFRQFKKKKIRYLIATDVAGRGLDFSHVSHVINWNLPGGNEQYTHRTGRTGRMGREGKAFTFITKHELPKLRELIHKKKITACWLGDDPFLRKEHTAEHKPAKHRRPFRGHRHTRSEKKPS